MMVERGSLASSNFVTKKPTVPQRAPAVAIRRYPFVFLSKSGSFNIDYSYCSITIYYKGKQSEWKPFKIN